MITILPKDTRLWLGSHTMVIADPEGAAVDFENVDSKDALAEILAGNIKIHGPHLDLLAHEETITRLKSVNGHTVMKDGKAEEETVKVWVSYGAGGSRIERDIDEVGDIQKIQQRNVEEADKAAEKAAKEAEKQAKKEEEARKTAAEDNAQRAEELQKIQDAQATSVGGAELRQPTNEPPPESNTTAPLDAPEGTQAFTTRQPTDLPPPATGETAPLDAPGGIAASLPETRSPGEDAEDEQGTPLLDKPKGKLPDDFPGRAALGAEGINTYNQLSKRLDSLTDISGIGAKTAEQIEEAYNKASAAEKEA